MYAPRLSSSLLPVLCVLSVSLSAATVFVCLAFLTLSFFPFLCFFSLPPLPFSSMDLMLGGDLKFHLINAGRFTEKRARFYAAEVLLGLEHVHSNNVIYRDMKLENVLLDSTGHCKISDLGLAVITKTKIKGYAGTPGYVCFFLVSLAFPMFPICLF
jgi:serine/threonine protein kinase